MKGHNHIMPHAKNCVSNAPPVKEIAFLLFIARRKRQPEDAQPKGYPAHGSSTTTRRWQTQPKDAQPRSRPVQRLFNDNTSLVYAAYAKALRRHGIGIRSPRAYSKRLSHPGSSMTPSRW